MNRFRLAGFLALACSTIDCIPRKPPGATGTAAGGIEHSADAPAGPSLRQAAAPTGRRIGVALATWFFEDPRYQPLAAREYDSLTAENEMKWYAVEPDPGRFTFDAGDRLVRFAEENGMRVRGHTLVWHSQLAAWVKKLSGKALHDAMLRHVTLTAEHYRGKIAQWDVVNEAVDETGKLRADSPFSALGPGYVADAFRAAHAADPQAELFYNDYEIEDFSTPKSQGAYELVRSLKESGVPLHGVGFQMHLEPRHWPSPERMQATLERYAALGVKIELTEIDVPLGEIAGSAEQKLAEQATLAQGVVRACLAVKACTGMTFWGLTDRHSWLSSPDWARLRGTGPHRPLPFDEDYRRKPMHAGIVEALGR
ncbi:MAG TPA: endo-1,4-beta-xylanase [Polyangiaceae bacterium]